MTSLRLGTRASALATAQSRATAALIAQATGVTVDLTHIRTDGDVLTGSLATMGGAGVFVTAIRQALLAGDIDIAVHSLKDLPTTPHEGTTIIVPERENPQDALCSRHGESLAHLPHGALVGTGSPAGPRNSLSPDLTCASSISAGTWTPDSPASDYPPQTNHTSATTSTPLSSPPPDSAD